MAQFEVHLLDREERTIYADGWRFSPNINEASFLVFYRTLDANEAGDGTVALFVAKQVVGFIRVEADE